MSIKLIEKAPAKVNLSLGVTGKQADDYHLLEMVNHSINLEDELILTPSDRFEFTSNVKELNNDSNLVVRVVQLFSQFFRINPEFKIELIKRIPLNAGLAGGSADAAAMIRLLLKYWGIQIPPKQLRYLALKVGADVPFCIENGTAYVEGIGERIYPLKNFNPGAVLVVSPDVKIATPEAFKLIDKQENLFIPNSRQVMRCIEEGNYQDLKEYAGNSFNQPIMERYPQLKEYLDRLYSTGAFYATMSGSGPTLVGYYDSKEQRDQAAAEFEDVTCYCID